MKTFLQLALSHDSDEISSSQGIQLIEQLCKGSDLLPGFYNAFHKQKSYKVYQIKIFIDLIKKREPFWQPTSNYSFVWNSDISFLKMRIGLYLVDDKQALEHILSADASTMDTYANFFSRIIANGIALSSISWMFRKPVSPHRLERMLNIYFANSTIPLQLFENEKNARAFYQYCSLEKPEEYLEELLRQPLYCISSYYKRSNDPTKYVKVQPVLADLDVVDRAYILLHELAIRFPSVDFSRLLTEKTIHMPAVIKMIMDKSCPSLDKILSNRLYPVEILVEWYDWACSGLDNFEAIYSELCQAASRSLYRAATPADLSLKLRTLKGIVIECKKAFLPLPAGICFCESAQDMNDYMVLYCTGSSPMSSGEVQCLFNEFNSSCSSEYPDSGIRLAFDPSLEYRAQNTIRRAIEKTPALTKQLLTGKTYQVQLHSFAQYFKGISYTFSIPPQMCGGLTILIAYKKDSDIINVYL